MVLSRLPRASARERGAATVYLLVLLVPVLFGLIGFAVDLGMLYSIKGELKAGAGAMALAAAQQLIGTDTATAGANTSLQVTGNNYYFYGLPIGKDSGSVSSTISDPAYYATLADALASGSNGGSESGSAQARYVRVTVTGQFPLLFWGFLPNPSGSRNVTVLATAVAGISAPLCQACGIQPFALAAINQGDATDFGFTPGTKYSLGYLCTVGNNIPPPAPLPGSSQLISYLLLNRFDPNSVAFPDEGSQAFQDGAGGLPGNLSNAACPTGQSCACFRMNNTETIWPSAIVNSCGASQVAPVVTDGLCGVDARFESTPSTACGGIQSIDTLSGIYQPDTDPNDYDAYAEYTGNGRRLVTVPIVDTLNGAGSMTVLGFRQFLLIPNQGTFNINSGDPFGRFIAMYVGSVAPVPQGRFDGCQQTAGPGKVVLHQ